MTPSILGSMCIRQRSRWRFVSRRSFNPLRAPTYSPSGISLLTGRFMPCTVASNYLAGKTAAAWFQPICARKMQRPRGEHGLRQDEGADGSEPREVSGTTRSGIQRVSQAGFWAGLEISRLRINRTDGSLGEAAVMITPTIFQWYRILRQHYRFTVLQAVRGALWLAS